MAQLRQDYPKFQQTDTVIIIIGPENAKSFQKYFSDNSLPFTGLPDPKHHVLKLFGQEVNLFKLGRMPAIALIDKQGIVRFVHYGHSMSDIPANEDVLRTIKQLNAESII